MRAGGPPHEDADETPAFPVGSQFKEADVGARGIPESLTSIRLKNRLHAALQGPDTEAFPVLSFIAESEAG